MSSIDVDGLKKLSAGIIETFSNKKISDYDLIELESPKLNIQEPTQESNISPPILKPIRKVSFNTPPKNNLEFAQKHSDTILPIVTDFIAIGCIKIPIQTIYLVLVLVVIGCGIFYKIHTMENGTLLQSNKADNIRELDLLHGQADENKKK